MGQMIDFTRPDGGTTRGYQAGAGKGRPGIVVIHTIFGMPIMTLLAATAAMQQALAQLKEAGTPTPFVSELMSFDEFTDLIGLPEINDLEARFS